MFHTITGVDENDQNCIDFSKMKNYVFRDADKNRVLDTSIYDMRKQTEMHNMKGLTVGVVEEFQVEESDDRNKGIQKKVIQMLEDAGATIKVISVPLFKYVLPYHYSLLPSEAASNMARYEGIQFGITPKEFETSHN